MNDFSVPTITSAARKYIPPNENPIESNFLLTSDPIRAEGDLG